MKYYCAWKRLQFLEFGAEGSLSHTRSLSLYLSLSHTHTLSLALGRWNVQNARAGAASSYRFRIEDINLPDSTIEARLSKSQSQLRG